MDVAMYCKELALQGQEGLLQGSRHRVSVPSMICCTNRSQAMFVQCVCMHVHMHLRILYILLTALSGS